MGHQKLLSGSSSICGDLPGSSRTRARRVRNFSKFPGWPRFLCESRLLDCDCLQRATQQARLPLNQGTALVEPSLSSKSRCINTGTLTIRSLKHFEKRSWGKIWTTPAISSTTCGSGTWTICSRCADKRAPVGSIAQHQQSRPRLAERTHSSPASQHEGLS